MIQLSLYRDEVQKQQEKNSGVIPFSFEDSLSFQDVHFSYEDMNTEVLQGISFRIHKGETFGLVGSSGAGKTTIVDLILRLLTPTKGAIMLDNKNISDIALLDWRKNIGYVSQDIFLINDTFTNNIRFFNAGITDSEIQDAAKMAQIHDFIEQSPHWYDTIIGDRGITLSGGQRQRIVIARILATKPQILILDEATSALDPESEKMIHNVLENLRGKITVFIIAHRLSTVMNADTVVVLDHGKIVESASPKKLLEDENSYFYKMNNISS